MMRMESCCEARRVETRERTGMAEGIMIRRNKLLVFMRHGPKDEGSNLVRPEGADDMAKRAEALKPLLAGKSIVIYSSPIKHAVESAEIVAKALGIPEIKEDALLHEDSEDVETSTMLDRLRGEGREDACVLMTHGPVINWFKIALGDAWTKTDIPETFAAMIETKAE